MPPVRETDYRPHKQRLQLIQHAAQDWLPWSDKLKEPHSPGHCLLHGRYPGAQYRVKKYLPMAMVLAILILHMIIIRIYNHN